MGDGGGDDGTDETPHRRPRKPTGRSTKGEHVARMTIELVPEEVKRLGLDAFERIGQESCTTVERRISSLVEVTVVRPKFRAKTDEAVQAVKDARAEDAPLPEPPPQSWITVAPAPELPLPRAMAGPGLLANVIVRRFGDHLPYNRLENVCEHEGMRLGRSRLCGWLDGLRELFAVLSAAMLEDARKAPYLCTDATGVLVQAPETRGHFWVLVAPGRHVIFAFSRSHDSAAVDELLGGCVGFLVADAHVVYDHCYGDDGATEEGAAASARRSVASPMGSPACSEPCARPTAALGRCYSARDVSLPRILPPWVLRGALGAAGSLRERRRYASGRRASAPRRPHAGPW